MRKIKEVHIINPYGDRHYEVGQVINGLKIASFAWTSSEGYSEIIAWGENDLPVVTIVNCPMTIEYMEVAE